jgi:hypothetical protein
MWSSRSKICTCSYVVYLHGVLFLLLYIKKINFKLKFFYLILKIVRFPCVCFFLGVIRGPEQHALRQKAPLFDLNVTCRLVRAAVHLSSLAHFLFRMQLCILIGCRCVARFNDKYPMRSVGQGGPWTCPNVWLKHNAFLFMRYSKITPNAAGTTADSRSNCKKLQKAESFLKC